MTLTELANNIKEMSNNATPAPWGWSTYGDKCNAAVLGTFYAWDDPCSPVGEHVVMEIYDEKKCEYIRVADCDETIGYKDDNANYSDFAFCANLRNRATLFEAMARELEAWRRPDSTRREMQALCDETDRLLREPTP